MCQPILTISVPVFLIDIDMPEVNGFEVASFLKKWNRECCIGFVSNKDELVFQAFAYHPFFFIRKTHLDEELEPQLLELQKKMGVKVPKIELQTGRQTVEVALDTIWFVESEKNYLLFYRENMESHGTRDTDAVRSGDFSGVVPCDRPEWMDCMLDRVNSMYQRDKNHPAILIWSCGNESFGGRVIFEMSQLYRKMDPTRLVHYEGVNDDRRYNDTSDMESRMYTTVNEIREFLSKDRRKPYVCCEYAHAMGNSCGAMKKYMDLAEEEPLFQGGFIWDYIDHTTLQLFE